MVRSDRPICMGQDLCLARPATSGRTPEYLGHFLNSTACLEQLNAEIVGATFKRVNVDVIKKYVVLMPPVREQREIAVYFRRTLREELNKETEVSTNNGLSEGELPETFERDDYRVLMVAEKYQTGFDQPLLQTMYVVKRLAGVQAVQTLLRLNRSPPAKARTFVLDFANEEEDIYRAFKPYYEATPDRRKR